MRIADQDEHIEPSVLRANDYTMWSASIFLIRSGIKATICDKNRHTKQCSPSVCCYIMAHSNTQSLPVYWKGPLNYDTWYYMGQFLSYVHCLGIVAIADCNPQFHVCWLRASKAKDMITSWYAAYYVLLVTSIQHQGFSTIAKQTIEGECWTNA